MTSLRNLCLYLKNKNIITNLVIYSFVTHDICAIPMQNADIGMIYLYGNIKGIFSNFICMFNGSIQLYSFLIVSSFAIERIKTYASVCFEYISSVVDNSGWTIGAVTLRIHGGRLNIKTLNMLNCFKDYKRYVHILNCFLGLASPK